MTTRTMMLVKVLNVLSFVGLLSLIVYTVMNNWFAVPPPEAILSGSGFSGDQQLPKAALDAALTRYHEIVVNHIRISNGWRICAQVADWISFGINTSIGVYAGYLGFIPKQGDVASDTATKIIEQAREDIKKLEEMKLQTKANKMQTEISRTKISYIGIAAALSSALLIVGSRCQSEAEHRLKQADKAQSLAIAARKDIAQAKTGDEVQVIIGNYDVEFQK